MINEVISFMENNNLDSIEFIKREGSIRVSFLKGNKKSQFEVRERNFDNLTPWQREYFLQGLITKALKNE